jgi:hypothetical protein
MKLLDIPIERINSFLKNHSFVVENPFGDGFGTINLTLKVQLTGIKEMISVGERKDFIQYTIFLEDIDNDLGRKVINNQFNMLKTNDYSISNVDTTFYSITTKVNHLLRNFLKYLSVDNLVICTRIVNNLKNKEENITEGIIIEGKYDSVVRKLVKDVLSIIKKGEEGDYYLPEDISEEMTYNFPQMDTEFTIVLSINFDDSVSTFDLDGEYLPDDETISISLVINPKVKKMSLEEIHFELNELIRHELEHIIQLERGDKIPKKEPKKPLRYYSQKHELEAQIAGFKRRAKKERKPLEEVIRNWFEKYKIRHRLSPKEAEIVINRIIELS